VCGLSPLACFDPGQFGDAVGEDPHSVRGGFGVLGWAADGDVVWPDDDDPGRLAVGLDQFDFEGVGQVDLAVS